MKGTYLLFIKVKEGKRKIGALGEIFFPEGYYVYVGSAMNSIEARVRRHFSKEKRKKWHIDYLLDDSFPLFYLAVPGRLEQEVASLLSSLLDYVPKFGSTDSKAPSHLFYSDDIGELLRKCLEVLEVARQDRGHEEA